MLAALDAGCSVSLSLYVGVLRQAAWRTLERLLHADECVLHSSTVLLGSCPSIHSVCRHDCRPSSLLVILVATCGVCELIVDHHCRLDWFMGLGFGLVVKVNSRLGHDLVHL